MSVNLGLLLVAGVLGATGVYLLMERSLVRMLLGLLLVGNGINLLIVSLAGSPGDPPVRGAESLGATTEADPLAQAMVLTAIVITMGVAAFVLALTYRLFQINRQDDDLEDDSEDVKLLKGSLKDFGDRDRSDDPETGADTVSGDFFDSHGNPLTPEEFAASHRKVIEPDLMPEDAAVIDHLPEFSIDEMPIDSDDDIELEVDDHPDEEIEVDGGIESTADENCSPDENSFDEHVVDLGSSGAPDSGPEPRSDTASRSDTEHPDGKEAP